MAYDEGLARRISEMLGTARVTEKKMFGGLAFLSRGHMFVGIVGDTLMARIGPEPYAEALRKPHVREVDRRQPRVRALAARQVIHLERC